MILQTKSKVAFDINNTEHVSTALAMLKTNKWGHDGCPFRVSPGYVSIVEEIRNKILNLIIDHPEALKILTKEQ